MDIKKAKKPFWLRYKYYLSGGVIFFLFIIYLLVMSVGPSRLRQELDNLQIAEVKEDKFRDYLDVEGVATPRMTVKLNSSEAGIVEHIVAEEGSLLRKGDTILVLTNTDLLRSIRDEYDNLEKQRLLYREKLLQMEQKTSELKRNTLKTVHELNRLGKQYEQDKEEYSMGIRSRAQLDVSTDEYIYNQENTRLLLEELQQDSIKNIIQHNLLENEMRLEEMKYIRSRERMDNLIVRAPIEGQLSFLNVIPGEKVTAGVNIGELKETHNMKITASVSEYYIDRIYLNLPASITYRNEKYPLVVSKVSPEIKDRSFEIDLLFVDRVPDNMRIGKISRVATEMGQPENALVMDKGNFYQSTGGQRIFKINKEGNKAFRTPVVIGRQNPLQYEILEGLAPGDKVIISGYDNFGDIQELILK